MTKDKEMFESQIGIIRGTAKELYKINPQSGKAYACAAAQMAMAFDDMDVQKEFFDMWIGWMKEDGDE